MRYINSLIITFLCSLFLVGCGDEEYIRIESLSAMGDEFYCNQKVKLWMCVESSDLWHTDYEWGCDGGKLTQPQGLDEMTWQAPNKPGTYKVWCVAKVGDKKERREHSLYVSSYFFEKFETAKPPSSFSYQSGSKSSIAQESLPDGTKNSYLEIYASSATEVERYIRRTFGDPELCTPFYSRIKLGFVKNMPEDRIVVGSKKSENTLRYRWTFDYNIDNGDGYVTYLDFRWYPTICKSGLNIKNETIVLDGTPTVAGEYNIQIQFQYQNNTTLKKNTYTHYYYSEKLNQFKNGTYETVSLGVDEEHNVLVYLSGVEVLNLPVLKDKTVELGWTGEHYIKQWDIYYINGDKGNNAPVMYYDDGYASTAVLK